MKNSEVIRLYQDDPHFHQLVKMLTNELLTGPMTISEIHAAVDLAETQFEIYRKLHPDWQPRTREEMERLKAEAILGFNMAAIPRAEIPDSVLSKMMKGDDFSSPIIPSAAPEQTPDTTEPQPKLRP